MLLHGICPRVCSGMRANHLLMVPAPRSAGGASRHSEPTALGAPVRDKSQREMGRPIGPSDRAHRLNLRSCAPSAPSPIPASRICSHRAEEVDFEPTPNPNGLAQITGPTLRNGAIPDRSLGQDKTRPCPAHPYAPDSRSPTLKLCRWRAISSKAKIGGLSCSPRGSACGAITKCAAQINTSAFAKWSGSSAMAGNRRSAVHPQPTPRTSARSKTAQKSLKKLLRSQGLARIGEIMAELVARQSSKQHWQS